VIAAGGVIEDTLLGSGSYNLEGIELDLNQARSMTETNLGVLRDHFSNLFGYAVDLLRTQELRGPVPERPRHAILSGMILPGEDLINRPNGQMLGKLCTLLVATGVEWPDDVSWKVCESAILGSIYSGEDGSNTILLRKLKKEADQQKLMDRMCTFHRFMRQSRLAEAIGRSNANSVGQFHYNFIGR